MSPLLDPLVAAGHLSSLNSWFARSMAAMDPNAEPLVALALAVASRATEHGAVCADLLKITSRPPLGASGDPVDGASWPELEEWTAVLEESPLVSRGDQRTPLVLDARGRLYLYRYWDYQERLSRELLRRAASEPLAIDAGCLSDGIARLFPPGNAPEGVTDWQKIAAVLATHRNLCVISGGPGTGKTSTVAKILALLIEQARAGGGALPEVTLLAPTGKAAARLAESIKSAKSSLRSVPEVLEAIPETASTIHRALRPDFRRATQFVFNAKHRLASDVVVVDEASMVDLPLMTKLIEAIPAEARLILLGDEHQLASVEVGAILGDICATGGRGGYSAPTREVLERFAEMKLETEPEETQVPRIRDAIVELSYSYRFQKSSGIQALARAVNEGDAGRALAVLDDPSFSDVRLIEPGEDRELARTLEPLLLEGFRPYLSEPDPISRLRALGRFRVLCAHQRGVGGVEWMNALSERALSRAGLIRTDGEWYPRRPVLIRKNDYALGLFNGDVGLIDSDAAGSLRAFFLDSGGAARAISPPRLPEHETVFAMTIHKSQGSEFDEVLVVLPKNLSKVLTRELLYTAVTRAKHRVVLCGAREIISGAVSLRIDRASGLREALWASP